ncbi:hypothetical protein C8R47DRAFT_603180 [Mycena vitilis]|nr:hypothetical protein C8R47DRAFT_603180 [Mycena vitilis]
MRPPSWRRRSKVATSAGMLSVAVLLMLPREPERAREVMKRRGADAATGRGEGIAPVLPESSTDGAQAAGRNPAPVVGEEGREPQPCRARDARRRESRSASCPCSCDATGSVARFCAMLRSVRAARRSSDGVGAGLSALASGVAVALVRGCSEIRRVGVDGGCARRGVRTCDVRALGRRHGSGDTVHDPSPHEFASASSLGNRTRGDGVGKGTAVEIDSAGEVVTWARETVHVGGDLGGEGALRVRK